jgi:hypothetical protein
MRVVFRGEHLLAADGSVAHRFDGPGVLLPEAVRAASEPAWAAAIADVVASCPSGRSVRQAATSLTTHAKTPPAADALFSWVIAPQARA